MEASMDVMHSASMEIDGRHHCHFHLEAVSMEFVEASTSKVVEASVYFLGSFHLLAWKSKLLPLRWKLPCTCTKNKY